MITVQAARKAGVRTSADVVYENTRSAIVRGIYPPGSLLKIQDLADANAVSLTPVREALRILAAEGLIEASRNRIVRVASLPESEVSDIYNVRVELEVAALRQAFDHIGPDEVRRAWQLNQECMDLLKRGDERFFEIHEALHFTLYELSGSKLLMRFIKTAWTHSERCRWLASPPHVDLPHAEHHDSLLTAVEKRDLERALAALEVHIRHNLDVVLAVLRARSATPEP
jgi:DNA-binding GntR family transcriptional regulator